MTLSEKLKYAREKVNLTLAQVKDRTRIGESSLSDFEHGKREPRLSQLHILADAYHRSLSFFIIEKPPPPEMVLWRERPYEAITEIESRFLRFCEQYHNLEIWCNETLQSRLPPAVGDKDTFEYGDAQQLALAVRGELHLGNRPGNELLRILEEVCGVKIFFISFEPAGTAASTKSMTFGHAILLNAFNVRWRRNFDLAHELFHLLTWDVFRSSTDSSSCLADEREEKLATCFARHLLMPADVALAALEKKIKNGKISYMHLFDISRQFDVSVEALLWHMHFLYNRGPDRQDETKCDIEKAKGLAALFDERKNTTPPRWPARYTALAIKALRRGEMSIGRFAQYLEISRREAMTYNEQELDDDEEVQVIPA